MTVDEQEASKIMLFVNGYRLCGYDYNPNLGDLHLEKPWTPPSEEMQVVVFVMMVLAGVYVA